METKWVNYIMLRQNQILKHISVTKHMYQPRYTIYYQYHAHMIKHKLQKRERLWETAIMQLSFPMEDCQNRSLIAFYKQNNSGRSLDPNQKMIRTERDINVDSESF